MKYIDSIAVMMLLRWIRDSDRAVYMSTRHPGLHDAMSRVLITTAV